MEHRYCNKQRIFNSRPLVEVDQMQVDMRNCLKIFNSRPLVEVDLTKIANGALVDFQLTTSRGGRQQNFTINH